MKNIKIMVIDDEKSVLNFVNDLLHNFEVMLINSAFEAAQRIEQEEYDIYIIDYQMPILNGIELFEQLREKYTGKKRKYVGIFCTAYGTIHLFKTELIDGLFDYFIEKPFDADNFKKVFKQALVKMEKLKKE